jgi:hypothetical protein
MSEILVGAKPIPPKPKPKKQDEEEEKFYEDTDSSVVVLSDRDS